MSKLNTSIFWSWLWIANFFLSPFGFYIPGVFLWTLVSRLAFHFSLEDLFVHSKWWDHQLPPLGPPRCLFILATLIWSINTNAIRKKEDSTDELIQTNGKRLCFGKTSSTWAPTVNGIFAAEQFVKWCLRIWKSAKKQTLLNALQLFSYYCIHSAIPYPKSRISAGNHRSFVFL